MVFKMSYTLVSSYTLVTHITSGLPFNESVCLYLYLFSDNKNKNKNLQQYAVKIYKYIKKIKPQHKSKTVA